MEIEAKIKIQDAAAVRVRLQELGARLIGCYRELNQILDHPVLQLRSHGQGLRVRELQTLTGEQRPSTITYKGRVEPGTRFKSRPEIEFSIDSPAAAAQLLEALGFTRVLLFEKIRESWVHGACHIEIDELPQLGRFIEVEGPSEDSIAALLGDLGCAAQTHIAHSYVSLLLDHCRTAGRCERDIRFET